MKEILRDLKAKTHNVHWIQEWGCPCCMHSLRTQIMTYMCLMSALIDLGSLLRQLGHIVKASRWGSS